MIVGEDGGGFIWHGSSRAGRTDALGGAMRCTTGCGLSACICCDEADGRHSDRSRPLPGKEPHCRIRVRCRRPCECVCRFESGTCFPDEIDDELVLKIAPTSLRQYTCDGSQPDSTKARRVSADRVRGLGDGRGDQDARALTRAYAQGGMALCEGDMPGVGWCAYVETDGEICLNLLEFLGTDGDRAQPGAMKRARLNPKNALQATSPCGAVRIYESLRPGETLERTFAIGWARSADEARQTLQQSARMAARPYARGARSKTGAQGWKG